ncbi:MAG: bifunctional folylpolyglutamate synthase/dihydrofolate synthase [Firmicutes bacterium HGW-Firmicutes-16]|nr:MAG: bifunctional folylpolyglutamate synthase/dihydrofolate synthase [Firmicutes bacterium HGW-Firmicutes-16]
MLYCSYKKAEAKILTAKEAMQFIHEKVWQGSKPGLSRTRELLSKMSNPQTSLRFIHIAGTNGKGSTSAMLAGILQAAGLTTGLYTSPYISDFSERMRINGKPITDEELASVTAFCAPFALSMEDRPTEFELVTAIAMEYFARGKCDLVVLETGMGGRLDSTNVIESPLCSVITNIGLDHTRELGDTVEKIASEKAGIIKKDCPTVVYALPENVMDVISGRCREIFSSLTIADFDEIKTISDSREGQVFSYKEFENLELPLLGTHQLNNAAVALEVIKVLRSQGYRITADAVRQGLLKTDWPARFEIISEKPFFVVDGGHNPQCAETVRDNLLKYFPDIKRVVLFGVLADKDYMGQAELLNSAADVFVTITPQNPRALDAFLLADKLKGFGKPVIACESTECGIETALKLAGQDGVVCSVGSLYSAGRVRAFFGK